MQKRTEATHYDRKKRIAAVRAVSEAEAVPAFELWLEFEQHEPMPDDDPTDDFANIAVRLQDGRRFALNVWTFKFLQRARYPWPYDEDDQAPAEYLLPPDLFVERLDRPTLERVVGQLLAEGAMRSVWICPPEEVGH